MCREGNLAGCLGEPQVVKEEMGIQAEGIGCARAKVSTGAVAVERRHVWQNWSEEFVVESDRRRGPVRRALCAQLRSLEGDTEPLNICKEEQDKLIFLFEQDSSASLRDDCRGLSPEAEC